MEILNASKFLQTVERKFLIISMQKMIIDGTAQRDGVGKKLFKE